MPTPKEECESLADALLPFAIQQLEAQGEFYPFAGALAEDGSITTVGVYGADEHPDSQTVIDDLRDALRQGAPGYRATALIFNARVAQGPDARETDAIAAALDHRGSYSVIVYFPYATDGSEPGDSFASEGEYLIFGKGH